MAKHFNKIVHSVEKDSYGNDVLAGMLLPAPSRWWLFLQPRKFKHSSFEMNDKNTGIIIGNH